jgi:hypothetical protein
MISITTIQPLDSGFDSRTIINDNFTNVQTAIPDGTIVTTADGQTLTNKTLTSPVITSPSGLTKNDVGLSNVDNTSDATKFAATAVLTNKTYDTAGTGNVFKINTYQITDKTGTGKAVLDTSPTIATPTISKPVMSATNPTAQTYTPAGAGTATLDLSLSNQHFITMPAGDITIALTGDTNNQNFLIAITQDGGGSRLVTWFATIRWAGGTPPTLTTAGGQRDIFGFIRTGSATYDGLVVGQNI